MGIFEYTLITHDFCVQFVNIEFFFWGGGTDNIPFLYIITVQGVCVQPMAVSALPVIGSVEEIVFLYVNTT